MNERELEQLLDDAAADFTPRPDVGRLTGILHRQRRLTRPIVYGLSIAAALAISVGGAAAMTGGDDSARVVPADMVELPTTAESTTVPETTATATTTTTSTTTTSTTTTSTIVETTVPPSTEPVVSVEALVPEQPVAAPEPPTEAPAPAPPQPRPTAAPATAPAPPPPPPPPAPAATPAPTAPPETHAPETTAPPATDPPEPPPMGFSAVQTWGSCSLTPPYDEFSGTASAGSTISVTSPYGSGSTTADGSGHWYIQVFFPSAPPNQQFTVTVSAPQGSQSFSFIHPV